MSNVTAAIITIGDELLIGQVIDTNSAWIARHLNELGIDVVRRVAVGDNRDAILSAIEAELTGVYLLLVTGGLGPTADDITKPLLNEFFGGQMVVDGRVLEHLKALFNKRNRPFLERNLKQAEVPDTCTVLFNKMGTAPGMWFEKEGKVVIAMPGVPFEMISIMEDEALPRLRQYFSSGALLHRTIITAGEGESFIAEKIKDIEEALPAHIRLAYLPGAGMVRLRLTGRGGESSALGGEVERWQQKIAGRLEGIVMATEDIPLEQVIANWFLDKNVTLGLAESCTGGFLAHHITQVHGSSGYFKGGIVSYSNEVKERVLGVRKETISEFGVVSEQVAIEMAKGALSVLSVDYAFAVTGLMSKDAVIENVEVGTVWMAVADKYNVVTKKYWFPFDRARNKEMTVSMGMLMILKFINNG